jgi:predicted Rossmann-fold nucleotide-binding protein
MTPDNVASSESQNGVATNGTPRTKICVYCGASSGKNPAHMEAARQLAKAMAANNIDLGKFFPSSKVSSSCGASTDGSLLKSTAAELSA